MVQTISIRTLSMRRLAANPLQPAVTRACFPVPTLSTRRSYSIDEKAKEVEPGGQRRRLYRRLIIASVLAVAGLGVLWLRGGKGDISGAGHGANQEYKQSSEGNN
ncbi:hypothetical protein N7481_011634 [Penicillium waksmanii]|uniref:uncharacterized protein n=1 Tax=Penicillium waksmanii TaxID=69791 RepID=UPI00254829E1|nr:uncharacterized protein N7481_011634 [Penicillium waksmanii]KAJ5974424.1 hypothetical protein N7481_011634 [Penicillium waksmanii]